MKRWCDKSNKNTEDKQIDNFLQEIETVCKKHNMSIGHEDFYGSFLIEEYSIENIEWLFEATDCI